MDTPTKIQFDKYNDLLNRLKRLGSTAVAFSGGVDSALLLYAAHTSLGDRALAVTAASMLVPASDLKDSEDFCSFLGIHLHKVLYDPLDVDGFSENPPNRCYLCKRALFSLIKHFADENTLSYVVEGSNTDDIGDYRPGLRAIAELEIVSPMKDAGLSKHDIRVLSSYFGLRTAEKPSAACLASRFAYGETITAEGLIRIEKAEQLLRDNGFGQLRVRAHGLLARIEVPREDILRLVLLTSDGQLISQMKTLGFAYVTVDLQGYRTGSMNEILR